MSPNYRWILSPPSTINLLWWPNTFLCKESTAELIWISAFWYIKAAYSTISIIELSIFTKEDVPQFFNFSEFSRRDIALRFRKIGIGIWWTIWISISIEFCLQEWMIRICIFNVWMSWCLPSGWSTFSRSKSSICGAKLVRPIRFLRSFDGGIVYERRIAARSCYCWGTCWCC